MPRKPCIAFLLASACTGSEGTLITTLSDAGADTASAGGSGGSVTPPNTSMSWQIQLSGELDASFDVDLYDVDLHNNSEADLAALRAAGRLVACYFSAGTHETWRDDADAVPDAAIGNPHPAYPSESWLDVRDAGVRAVMAARIELAQTKGCDAIQPANLALSRYDSGFAIGVTEANDYAQFLAGEAHARGLSVAWSDEPDLFAGIEQVYDWGIAIQCLEFGRCGAWAGFQSAGKAVFIVEIGDETDTDRVCAEARTLAMPAVIKDNGYTAFRAGCP